LSGRLATESEKKSLSDYNIDCFSGMEGKAIETHGTGKHVPVTGVAGQPV
jgi:hypothetical protein